MFLNDGNGWPKYFAGDCLQVRLVYVGHGFCTGLFANW